MIQSNKVTDTDRIIALENRVNQLESESVTNQKAQSVRINELLNRIETLEKRIGIKPSEKGN